MNYLILRIIPAAEPLTQILTDAIFAPETRLTLTENITLGFEAISSPRVTAIFSAVILLIFYVLIKLLIDPARDGSFDWRKERVHLFFLAGLVLLFSLMTVDGENLLAYWLRQPDRHFFRHMVAIYGFGLFLLLIPSQRAANQFLLLIILTSIVTASITLVSNQLGYTLASLLFFSGIAFPLIGPANRLKSMSGIAICLAGYAVGFWVT